MVVITAKPVDYPVAIDWLFPGEPSKAGRALAVLRAGEFGPDALLAIREQGRVVGAILCHLQPGSAATIYPPGAVDAPTADALVQAVERKMLAAGVKQGQTLLRPAEAARAEPLLRGGFCRIAQLSLQVRSIPLLEAFDPPLPSLHFLPATAVTPGFAETLESTYDGTLDCPELNGVRDIREVLQGYHEFPKGERRGWFLVERAGQPVGVVLLGPGPRPGIVELSYLGLVPSARGRKFGEHLLRFALRETAARFAECLILNVDQRNAPALQLYVNAGFREYDRQDVYLWCAPGGSCGETAFDR